jgi:hypothetical protein
VNRLPLTTDCETDVETDDAPEDPVLELPVELPLVGFWSVDAEVVVVEWEEDVLSRTPAAPAPITTITIITSNTAVVDFVVTPDCQAKLNFVSRRWAV